MRQRAEARRLGILRAVVMDVPMPASYADERSSLHIGPILGEFTRRHVINTAKRIFYNSCNIEPPEIVHLCEHRSAIFEPIGRDTQFAKLDFRVTRITRDVKRAVCWPEVTRRICISSCNRYAKVSGHSVHSVAA